MSFTPTDIEMFQGAYFERDFEVTNTDGTPMDLRYCTIKAQVRTQPGRQGLFLMELAVADIGLSAGKMRLFAAASATKELPDPRAIPAQRYLLASWDVFVAPTGAASAVYDKQYAAGRAYIYPRSTQRE